MEVRDRFALVLELASVHNRRDFVLPKMGNFEDHEEGKADWRLARRRQTLRNFYRVRNRSCNKHQAVNRSGRFPRQRNDQASINHRS